MKHIIIPLLKLIGAISFTLIFLVMHVIFVPLYMLWELEWPGKDFFQWDYKPYNSQWTIFYKPNSNNYTHTVFFKSVFHFIWNIR